jgi:hypothetical protein
VRMSGTVPMTDLALRDKIMVRFLHFNFFHFPIVTWPTLFFSNFKRNFHF